MNDELFEQATERIDQIQEQLQHPDNIDRQDGIELYQEAKDLIDELREVIEPEGATFTVVREGNEIKTGEE